MELITEPHAHDVLSGRGNGANLHPGNIYFRSLVATHKGTYVSSSHKDKKNIKLRIVQQIQNRCPSGRFLHKNNMTSLWNCMNQKEALRKTGQALREDAPRMRSASEQAQTLNAASTMNRDTDDEMKCSAEDNTAPLEIDMNQLNQDFNKSLELSEVLNSAQVGESHGHNSNNRIDQSILDLLMASASSMASSNSNSLNISDAASLDPMDTSQREFIHNGPSFKSAPPYAFNYAAQAQTSDTMRKLQSFSKSTTSFKSSDGKFPLEEQYRSQSSHDEFDKRRFEDSLDFDKSVAKIDFSQISRVQDGSEGTQTEGYRPPQFTLHKFKSLSGRSLSMRSSDSESNSSTKGTLKEG